MITKDDSELPANLPVEDAARLLGWSVPLLAEAVREGSVFCRTVALDGWTGTRVSIGVANELGGPDNDCFVASREEGYRPNPGSLWCLPPAEAYPIVRDGRGEVGTVVEWWHRLRKYQGARLHFASPLSLDRLQVLVVRQTLPVPSSRRPFPVEHPLSPVVPQSVAIAPAKTRSIALVEAEDAALAKLRQKFKREPDFDEFWDHITKQDDTGTVSDYTDDRLMWTGKDGRKCETAKSTICNRLTAAKKRNPFNALTRPFPQREP